MLFVVQCVKVLTSDICAENLYPKPYMFLARPALNTIRKKRDTRESMTFNEYLVSFLKMLRHPKAAPYFNHALLLEHLQQVVEDSLIREWSVVRQWSQAMFDEFEPGDHAWENKSHTQLKRIRYALLAQKSQHNDSQECREVPCRDFNSLTGCIHNGPPPGPPCEFHSCLLLMHVSDRGQDATHRGRLSKRIKVLHRRQHPTNQNQYKKKRDGGPSDEGTSDRLQHDALDADPHPLPYVTRYEGLSLQTTQGSAPIGSHVSYTEAPSFNIIRRMYETDKYDIDIDLSPRVFAEYRSHHWPINMVDRLHGYIHHC